MIREQLASKTEVSRESKAYREGWEDGRFGASETFTSNANLSACVESERLAYYRGHREGKKIREMLRSTGIHA